MEAAINKLLLKMPGTCYAHPLVAVLRIADPEQQ